MHRRKVVEVPQAAADKGTKFVARGPKFAAKVFTTAVIKQIPVENKFKRHLKGMELKTPEKRHDVDDMLLFTPDKKARKEENKKRCKKEETYVLSTDAMLEIVRKHCRESARWCHKLERPLQ